MCAAVKKKVQLTPKKYKALKDEYDELRTIGRKLLADKLDQYRLESEQDDSSAYSAVLEEKMAMEDRIKELSDILESAEVSEGCPSGKDKVSVGCEVTIDVDGKKRDFTVVSPVESDPEEGRLPEDSPLGSALMGRKIGEEFSIDTPTGKKKVKVESIS
ncbi:GreA/GreB family elongation factor [Candidatus Dojkabacteria bacterium]|nr:GreA/GreB family elongation factor [Candidatus Dojkabacteria bacterium]